MHLLALVLSLESIPSRGTWAFRDYLSMCPLLFFGDPERVTWTFGALPQRSPGLKSQEGAVPPSSGAGLDTPGYCVHGIDQI